jgi:branched-chain amino acid aminotransferase
LLQKFDERNRDLVVNVNGRLVARGEAGVSPFDSVVQGGDAVWEGLRLYRGRIFRLEQHLDRLVNSAKALAFEGIPARDSIFAEIRRTLEANRMFDGVHIRLTLTRGVKITSGMDPRLNQSGPTLIVLAEHKAPVYSRDGLSLVTSSVRRFPPDCLDPRIHHNNLIQSILAKIEANVAGADDALMLDTRGFVAETNATHVSSCSAAACGRRESSPVRKASRGRRCSTCARLTGSPATSATSRRPRCIGPTRHSAPARWANSPL